MRQIWRTSLTWQRAAAFLFLLTFALAAANMFWTASQVHASQRRWCSALVTLDNADQHSPPGTQAGRRLFADFHKLRGEFGCGG